MLSSCRYVRLLGAAYLRLVGKPVEVFNFLEPLLNDYRKVRIRKEDGSAFKCLSVRLAGPIVVTYCCAPKKGAIQCKPTIFEGKAASSSVPMVSRLAAICVGTFHF